MSDNVEKNITCKFRYLKKNGASDILVDYNILDKDNKEILSRKRDICFREITLRQIPENAAKIVIISHLDCIPYSPDIIQRWITEINALGFLCELHFIKGAAHFVINLKDYQYKSILISTVQLIHVIYETGCCYIPELYFNLIDDNPNIDRFDAIQIAHRQMSYIHPFVEFNYNHCITSNYSSKKSVSKNTFLRNAALNKKIFEAGSCNVYLDWSEKTN